MWYKSGRLSLFSGSKIVLGNNTFWANKNNGVIAGGMLLIFTDCGVRIYEIASVVSDTELVLANEYCGCTENHVRYAIPVLGSNDTFDHAAYVAQIAAMLAGYQSQLTQWKQVLTEHGQVTLTDNNGQSVVVKTLPELTDAVSRMMDKTLNGADIPDKAQFVANLGLSDVVHKSDLANHSHTAAQITDFTDAVRKVLVSTLAAGQGVALNYDAGSNQLVVSATGGNSGGGNSGSNGGRGYTVVTRNGTTANQVLTFPFSVTGTMDYSFDAYALKEEAGLTNQSLTLESFDAISKNSYNQTAALVWDGTVKPYTGSQISLTQDGSWYSAVVATASGDLTINAVPPSLVPKLTSATSATGITIAQSSVFNNDPRWYGWKAFDGGETGEDTRWSTQTGAPQWLSVAFNDAKSVDYYFIVCRQTLSMGGVLKDWLFQGSDDGTNWVTLDSQSGVTFTSNEKKIFSINQATYKYFRIYVSAVNTGDLVTITEFGLMQHEQKILLRSGNNYYTSINGVLSQVKTPSQPGDIAASGFIRSGKIDAASLADKLPLSVVAEGGGEVAVSFIPGAQIILPKSLTSVRSSQVINSAQLSTTLSGKGAISVAVSRNLNDWVVWNGSAWVSIGSLSADSNGANKLLSGGMSVSSLNQITTAQWAQLFPSTNGVPDTLAFALVLNVPDPSLDNAAVDALVLNVNNVSAWKKQTEAEVEIRWYPDKVTFKTVAAGNYKLAYQQP
ncbi:coagulation factor 5/8 type domain protein [Dickeya chrysanthemi Ech1591]|uniref:Coagulation factor 5/8 type domain protein n=1 Tax=Dickeya chrysanthemi (strain Ech1591) TaxID=561229 RepID=C6CM05_DICC1|nr:discoidin domain-containing protein [Dickeya chrysanthemi]ACT07393.1 coagulation factor 5/8 type domain protein [Dickeya chrysanthemi Ech1591]